MHGRLLANFQNPAAIRTSQSRSVWNHGDAFHTQASYRNWCQQQRQHFPQQCRQQQEFFQQCRHQQGRRRGSGSRRCRQGHFHANDSSSRAPAPTSHKWSAVGGGSPDSLFPQWQSLLDNCCASCTHGTCWSGSHNLHWIAHPCPSAPGIHPRTCRQQWTSSCSKGQSSQCSIQKPRVSSAVSFLVPKTVGICVMS